MLFLTRASAFNKVKISFIPVDAVIIFSLDKVAGGGDLTKFEDDDGEEHYEDVNIDDDKEDDQQEENASKQKQTNTEVPILINNTVIINNNRSQGEIHPYQAY